MTDSAREDWYAVLERLSAALDQLEDAIAARERQVDEMLDEIGRQTQEDAEEIARRVDRAIDQLETVLKE